MKKFDLCVIGGGFWGSACALMARERGYERVVVLDNGDSRGASRNAGGGCSLTWYKSGSKAYGMMPERWRGNGKIGEAVGWLVKKKLLSNTGRWCFSWNGNVKRQDDFYTLVGSLSFNNVVKARVDRVECVDSGCVIFTKRSSFNARKVVLAAGVWTDDLLRNSGFSEFGVKQLRGRAVKLRMRLPKSLSKYKDLPIMYMARPYKHYALHHIDGNEWYWGATTEDGRGAVDYEYMLECAEKFFGSKLDIVSVFDGLRPVCDDRFVVEKVHKRIVVATGGHRVGLGLAPLAASDALRMLK